MAELSLDQVGRRRFHIPDSDRLVFGSDRRVRRGDVVVDRCKLCLKRDRLQLSHIVPRWAFEACKAEGSVNGSYKSLDLETKEQDGSKHYLLCENCEQHLGLAERYVSQLTKLAPGESRAGVGAYLANGSRLLRLNAELIQRFVLGVVLKPHFALSPPHHTIELPASLVGALRDDLCAEKFARRRFKITLLDYTSRIQGIDPRAMVFSQVRQNEVSADHTFVFDWRVGGWGWFGWYSVAQEMDQDKHLREANRALKKDHLTTQGECGVTTYDVMKHPDFGIDPQAFEGDYWEAFGNTADGE